MPAAHSDQVVLTNSSFMLELAQAASKGSVLWVAGFVGNPDMAGGGNWAGQPYNVATMAQAVDGWGAMNTYFSVGALRPDANGEVLRRKSNFDRLLALVADDVAPEDLQGSPSWVLNTSPGKRQVGILLDHDDGDCADIELCTRLVSSMAERGFIKADKSGNNVVRYVRLPVGQNQKPRPGGPFAHVVEDWNPKARYTLVDAAAMVGIDLDALRSQASSQPAAPAGIGNQDELTRTLTSNILRGEHLHDSINMLAASIVASGMAGGAAVNMLRGLMECSAAPRDERFAARMADIPRSVSTAQQKFAPVVTLSLLRDNRHQVEEEPVQPDVPVAEVPAHLLTVPGFLGKAVQWINATARKPQPLFSVQAALALGSVLMGRKYRSDNGNWSALYFLNVGVSGSGKEHAKYAVESLLEAAGLGNLIGVGRFASESSVVSSLIEKPAQFSVLDEFGKLLQAASVANNFADRNTMKALMEVWGRTDGVLRPVAYSTAGLSSKQAEDLAKRFVRKPSLTLLAMSTPDTLFSGLTSSAVSDGFLNRFLTVHSDRGRQLARVVESIDAPAELLEWMRQVFEATPPGGNLSGLVTGHDMEPAAIVLPFDAGALRVFAGLEQAAMQRMNELDAEGLSEMLTRTTEIAMRLALIVAVSCGHVAVLRQDAAWAMDYVLQHGEAGLSHLRDKLADGPFDLLCKEVLRLVKNAAERGMTERDLNKASRAWRSANTSRIREEALRALDRRGEITQCLVPSSSGKGRQRFAWVTPAVAANYADNADKAPTDASPQ